MFKIKKGLLADLKDL